MANVLKKVIIEVFESSKQRKLLIYHIIIYLVMNLTASVASHVGVCLCPVMPHTAKRVVAMSNALAIDVRIWSECWIRTMLLVGENSQ